MMFDDPVGPGALRPQELEAVYAISNAVAGVADVDDALDHVMQLTRPVLIFDNIVVYVPKRNGQLEPTYARIVGRGRAAEADLAWGEIISNEVFYSGIAATQYERLPDWESNRLKLRY